MPIILILVSIGIFFLFIDPQIKGIEAVNQTIRVNDEMIELGNNLREDREQLQEKYSNISSADKEILRKILPDTVDNVRLILDINNIADDFGITITNIGVEGGSNSETEENENSVIDANTTGFDYGAIELSFSVVSTYNNFKRFMMDLEDSLRLVDITSFSVAPASTETGELYSFSVSLNTYWLR